MAEAAARHGVPIAILFAVALTESGRGGALAPYAMNIEGQPLFPTSKSQAVRAFERAYRRGYRLIDLGCMQINHHYHHRAFLSVAHMLDPAANVDYAARFLKELEAREGSWTMALARYHAGPDNDPAHRRYVCRVVRNLVESGFGSWTGDALRLCRPGD